MARDKETNLYVAIKQLSKQDLIQKGKTKAVMREKEMLKTLVNKPFIIRLQLTFMDKDYLYFVFDHCMYGTLSKLITLTGGLSHRVV